MDIPNILKQRKQLAKLVLDYDSARARFVQSSLSLLTYVHISPESFPYHSVDLIPVFPIFPCLSKLRWLQATKSIISGTNTQALTAKADLLKEEMDESMNKVELCKVNIMNKDDWCLCMASSGSFFIKVRAGHTTSVVLSGLCCSHVMEEPLQGVNKTCLMSLYADDKLLIDEGCIQCWLTA